MHHSRNTLAAGLAVLALTLSACGSASVAAPTLNPLPDYEAGTSMARIAAAGRIKVGITYDQPRFGFKSLVTFAGPYYIAGQQLMIASNNAAIKSRAALKANPRQKVCSVSGSISAEQIKPYLANLNQQLVTYDNNGRCATALSANEVQVVTSDSLILEGFVAKVRQGIQARRRSVRLWHRYQEGRCEVLRVHQPCAQEQCRRLQTGVGGQRRNCRRFRPGRAPAEACI